MESPSPNTSPIHSTRLFITSPEQFSIPSPHYSSDPYFECHGNQMAYYDQPYPVYNLPSNAGEQYLSPQSSSPCVKMAARLKPWQSYKMEDISTQIYAELQDLGCDMQTMSSSQNSEKHTSSPKIQRKRIWDVVDDESPSSQTESSSSSQTEPSSSSSPVAPPPKRRRLAPAPLASKIRAMEQELAMLMRSAEKVAKEIVRVRLASHMHS